MDISVTFIDELDVHEIDDNTWELDAPFAAIVTGDVLKKLEVPKGFITDFASVPRIPIAYFLAGNTAHMPAVLHDYLYSFGGTDEDRFFADNVLRAAMITNGDPGFRRWLVYRAVRMFGSSHFGVKRVSTEGDK